jgi:hypothetical protein
MGWSIVLAFLIVLLPGTLIAQAGELHDRMASYPNWDKKPVVEAAIGDLDYPDWFAGTWTLTSTLVDMTSPLAPDIVSPGFESNRQYVDQPITCQIRFIKAAPSIRAPLPLGFSLPTVQITPNEPLQVISDRAFNGLNLAKAYLGEQAVQSVKVDPANPNRQITRLRGEQTQVRELVSIVSGRKTEAPDPTRFMTTEIFQQTFQGNPKIYLNEVENTTSYQLKATQPPSIEADQITAIYLSPQDPDYFKAIDRPIALYRYRLELILLNS